MLNRSNVMKRAHELKKEWGYTLATAQRLAWAEARGVKLYAMHMPHEVRKAVSLYLNKLLEGHLQGTHDASKYSILRGVLRLPEDAEGVVVMSGKECGNVKNAVRQMAAA